MNDMSSQDHRQAAQARVADLLALLQSHPGVDAGLLEECESLGRAIAAFHMEGIRFRIFNVDRAIARGGSGIPAGATPLLEAARRHLEAAGFHTRSHQAPV
jgi:hypothetical protein